MSINIKQKLSLFSDHWNPRIVGELNGQHVKLAKLKGEFVWHKHDNEDEMFLVIKGSFDMHYRDRIETIKEGELPLSHVALNTNRWQTKKCLSCFSSQQVRLILVILVEI